MSTLSHDKKPPTRSLALVFLAWVFISGQALLTAGSVYNYNNSSKSANKRTEDNKKIVPWALLGQGANKMRVLAMQARPDVVGNVAIFLAVANALGLTALMCGLLAWSRSKHVSGKLSITAATVVILVNSLLNLPYA